MPDQYGNWLPQDLFAGGIPQLQPKPGVGVSPNPLMPGLGVPAGMAGGVLGTAVGNPLVSAALDAAKLPGDVYQGNVDLSSPAGFGRAQNMAGMLMGGGMPMAEAGAAGIFGGRLAKTANLPKLEEAKAMQAAGHAGDAIWKSTGWFQGADGAWRFEIPDTAANFTLPTASNGNDLGRYLNHPELFKAYPELAETQVQLGGLPGTVKGRFMRGSSEGDMPSTIALNYGQMPKNPTPEMTNALTQSATSTLLHELQHNIQDIEGFAAGANAALPRKGTPSWDVYQELTKSLTLSPENFKALNPTGDYRVYQQIVKEEAMKKAAVEAYRRQSGEVEARNVQWRYVKPSELQMYPPYGEDVMRENQIQTYLPYR